MKKVMILAGIFAFLVFFLISYFLIHKQDELWELKHGLYTNGGLPSDLYYISCTVAGWILRIAGIGALIASIIFTIIW